MNDQNLSLTPDDPRLTAFALGELEGAEQAFHIAISCGLEENRALPYLAEIAFRQREFTLVRDHLAALARSPVTQVMAPIVRFWQPPREQAA